jgi:hypothetical protein
MPRAAVEMVLDEEPAWFSEWPGSMGQSYAVYARAGLTVFYSAEGRVLRSDPLWPKAAAPSAPNRLVPGYVVVPGEGNW